MSFKKQDNTYKEESFNKFISAFDLYNYNLKELPTLVTPLFQKVGLVSLSGTSDVGKSTILRQLALSIAIRRNNWLGFPLHTDTSKVIYVSTEDDKYSVSIAIKQQLAKLKFNKETESELLKNISFLFDTEKLDLQLRNLLKTTKVDLIVLDAFTDIFSGEINSSTEVRKFLKTYHQIAMEFQCLIIILHHTGKRTQYKKASKDHLLGSQAFEAKMRCVIELRADKNDKMLRHLCVLKGNYLGSKIKNESYVLQFDEESRFFTNTQKRIVLEDLNKNTNSKFKNQAKMKAEVLALRSEIENGKKMSYRKIADKLKLRFGDNAPSKSTIQNWVKEEENKDT